MSVEKQSFGTTKKGEAISLYENAVEIHYEGISDQDTVANMTNHSYFNLGGHDSGNVYEQTIQLNATTYTPVSDPKSIPTGELAPVAGTPMDFTEPKAIGKEIDADFAQLQMTGGYDHNFVLDKPEGAFDWMAKAYCEKTGIAMEAYTDCPAVQFYAANFVNGEKGKNGAVCILPGVPVLPECGQRYPFRTAFPESRREVRHKNSISFSGKIINL